MTSRILIIGSLNIDLITRTPRVPSAGETLTAASFSTGCGGKGANQAVACARASRTRPSTMNLDNSRIQVCMIGAVGSDTYGTQLLNELTNNEVDVTGVGVHEGQVSGVAVVLVEETSGENRILVIPGANGLMKPTSFMELVPPLPDLVVLQLEIPLETVLAVMKAARQQGVEVLLNPAPPLEIPNEALQGLGHLIMNETEAGILAGEMIGEVAHGQTALKKVFEKFSSLGVQNTVVTLGARGVCFSAGGGKYNTLSAIKVAEVVDTTAAGDTFVGAYAVELVRWKTNGSHGVNEKFDIARAVEKANRAAARTVQKAGAMQSIPWMDEV